MKIYEVLSGLVYYAISKNIKDVAKATETAKA